MLTAYMDESGHSKHPESRFVGMGGLIADSSKWEELGKIWKAALDDAGIKRGFHMRDFAHRQGEFKNWKEGRRRELFAKLVGAIVDIEAVPVGAVVSLDDYDAAPEILRSFYKEPYFMCFQQVTKGAALQALPKTVPFVPETVAMVYAYQKEFGATVAQAEFQEKQAGSAQQLWHAMKKHTHIGQWMGTYSSAYAEELYPLQAADLFAYELTKEFENLIKRPNDDMRWALRRILRPLNSHLEGHRLIAFYDGHEMIRIFLEATRQDNDPAFQSFLTQAWLNKAAVRDLLRTRIEKYAK